MKGPWTMVLQIRLYKTWCCYISFSPSDYDNQTGEERNAAPPLRIKNKKAVMKVPKSTDCQMWIWMDE